MERFSNVEMGIVNNNTSEHKIFKRLKSMLNIEYSKIILSKTDLKDEKDTIKVKVKYIEENKINESLGFYVLLITILASYISIIEKMCEYFKLDGYLSIIIMFSILFALIIYFIHKINKESFERSTKLAFYELSLSVLEDIEEKLNQNNINSEGKKEVAFTESMK